MNKHLFRKVLAMFLLVAILVGTMAMPVSAADSKMTIKYIFYGTEYLTFPVTYYDGTSATARMSGINIHFIDGQVAYCLEPQATSTANTIYSSFPSNDNTFWTKKISPAKQNAIMLAVAYGAPNKLTSSNSYTNYGYMAATQIVIWEFLMDYRSTTPPYACTNSRLYNHMIKASGGNSDDVAGMKSGYAAISASLAAHGKLPSFAKVAQASAETYQMQYNASAGNYTLILTDANGAISNDFTFTGEGVTCTKSGNTLTVTAPASAVQGKTVMVTGVGSNPDVSSIAPVVWGTSNSNGSRDQILMQYGKPDPVRVFFKVTASNTSLDIVKQSSDGKVADITFTVTDSSGNTLFSGKTNSAGKLNVPNLVPGQKVTVTETVPDNYVADQRVQTITLTAGTNTLTFKNYPKGSMTIKKASDEGDVEGYCFKLYQWTANKSWYGKSDASGNVYVTDQNYAASGTKAYTFTGFTDGKYTFVEVLSKHGKDQVFPDSIRITITNKGSTKYDHTFTGSELAADSNGDCRVNEVQLTGLSDGGVMSITVHNKPTDAPVEIIKTSTDGVVKGISFKVEQYEPTGGIGWWDMGTYKTDSTGKILLDPLPIGTKLRITEIVPDDYICLSENPQTITVKGDGNRVSFENKPVAYLEIVKHSDDGNISNISFDIEQYEPSGGIGWWKMGTYKTNSAGKILIDDLEVGTKLRITEIVPDDYVSDNRVQEITLVKGVNTVTFQNHPRGRLEIVKLSDDGNVGNISFVIEQYEPSGGIGWWELGTYKTDSNGKIHIEDLDVGYKLRITEIVPENYVADKRVQEITTKKGLNTVSFQNHPVVNLELFKTSDDGNVAGIEFTLEKKNGKSWSALGTYVTDEDGAILVPELELGATYRITETVPEGYVGEQPVQEFTAQLDTNTVRFSNRLIRGNLLIVKLDRGTKTPLQGAGFAILNDAGEEIAREYTDENGEIFIAGLPYGQYSYQEVEAPEGFELDETIYPFAISEDGETISVEKENDIFPGSIPIYKVDEDHRPLPGVTFLLEYSADNGNTWAPVFYRDPESAVIAGGCTSEGLTNGKLTTGVDGRTEYSGLCIDTQLGKVLYRLTEASTKPGYNLLTEPAFEGSLPLEGETEVALTIVNTPTFKMPTTGGHGFAGMVSAMSIAGIAAALLLYTLTKKRRKN